MKRFFLFFSFTLIELKHASVIVDPWFEMRSKVLRLAHLLSYKACFYDNSNISKKLSDLLKFSNFSNKIFLLPPLTAGFGNTFFKSLVKFSEMSKKCTKLNVNPEENFGKKVIFLIKKWVEPRFPAPILLFLKKWKSTPSLHFGHKIV